jgi:O-antigen ligase
MLTILNSPEERDRSASSRLEIWAAAWEMIKEYPMGVGIGQFEHEIGAYLDPGVRHSPDAHNTYVLCAAETGFPGLAAFLLTLGAAWYTLARLSRRVRTRLSDPDQFELMIYASRLSLIVYMVGGLFTSRFYTEGMWMLIMLPACLARAVENELRVEVREEAKLRSFLTALGRQGSLMPAT